ncbi:MAG: SAM-dependent methyltransferase, partial [Pseudomonadota bacterium]
MPITPPQLEAASEVLGLVLKFDRPADVILSYFFRGQRALGVQDRVFIAEAVFGTLRRKRLVDHLIGEATPRRILLAYLVRIAGISARELQPALAAGESEWLVRLKSAPADELPAENLPLGVQADLPDWLIERLRLQMPETDILALGRALQQAAPLDLRVNTLRGDRDSVLGKLAADGLAARPTPYSP